VTLAFRSREPHPVVDELLRELDRGGPPVERAIDAEDEMLLFARALHESDDDAALAAYFRDGLSVASAIRQLAAWRGGLAGLDAMLDFASGYGRVTRFLVREIAAERLWVSDIYGEAMSFQASTFGVRTLRSALRPEEFACDQRFDLVFVTSLFTHLPEATFRGWLARLLSLLTPAGMLAFSVHDQALLPPGVAMPERGFFFAPSSESRSLDPHAYGSTWVSESFVRATAASLAPGAVCVRLPRALGRFQDLYVLDRAGDGGGPRAFDPGPFGFLDRCAYHGTGHGRGELELRGWGAQATGGGNLRRLSVRLGGEPVAELATLAARPDVQAAFPEAGDRTGFELRVPLPEGVRLGSLPLVIEAETTGGVRAAIDAGTVTQALLRSTRGELAVSEDRRRHESEVSDLRARRLELEARALAARIAAMEASRFWKLRNAWFRVKRGLGLTREP
jgi:SAM-dependent methyltransferase